MYRYVNIYYIYIYNICIYKYICVYIYKYINGKFTGKFIYCSWTMGKNYLPQNDI